MALFAGDFEYLPFTINATDLAAGTGQEVYIPRSGYVVGLFTVVQEAIVTGGVIDVKTGAALATTVGGLSQTIADSATVGTRQATDATAGSSTRVVAKGDRLSVVPSAAFNGGGAMRGFVVLASADVSPA